MRDVAAIHTALAMAETPSLVRTARRAALPTGMTFLLEVAANDADAFEEATVMTGQPQEALREACGFFIEQILLTNNDDSYRVLASSSDRPATELRRHMALLLKWLHPDVAANAAMNSDIDRSVFVNRVTLAWEDLKTQERRDAYGRVHGTKKPNRKARIKTPKKAGAVRSADKANTVRANTARTSGSQINGISIGIGAKPPQTKRKTGRRIKRLTIQPLGNDNLFSRLVLFLKGQR